MSDHGSVRLGPGGRRRIVEAVEAGLSQRRAAARFCVSPATVNRWVARAREARPAERASGAPDDLGSKSDSGEEASPADPQHSHQGRGIEENER